MKKITPKRYIQGFCLVVVFLAIIRTVFPPVANEPLSPLAQESLTDSVSVDNSESEEYTEDEVPDIPFTPINNDDFIPHRIYSVASFKNSFPDQNDVQLIAAEKNGVKPVYDRSQAEKRMDELVYVGSLPYVHIDKMKNSIPYLVPKASVLLQDIGRIFFDSLQVKGIPLHKIIVTSVLRTQKDVEELQKRNFNAATKSCHQYGTTFDICYNRYKTVEAPEGPKRREVRNDSLKWVLSEVLNDIRNDGRCYVKYEVKQGCFHITVR